MKEIKKEEPLVPETETVPNPEAVMIESHNTLFADITVIGPWRLHRRAQLTDLEGAYIR